VSAPISATLSLTELAERLVHSTLADHVDERRVTLLAISVSNLVDQRALQLELPFELEDQSCDVGGLERPGSRICAARSAVDASIDQVRRRFGNAAVGYASIVLSDHGSVPDAFRELAEHEL
jgi:DNA polymerase-4